MNRAVLALRALPPIDRRLARICLVVLAACAIGLPLLGFDVVLASVGIVAGLSALLGVTAVYYQHRNEPRLRDIARASFWGVVISNLSEAPICLVCRVRTGFSDASFAAIDHAFGFDTGRVVLFVNTHAQVGALSDAAYISIIPFSAATLILAPLLGRTDRAERLLVALLLAMVPTLLIFALVRAVGPWTVEGFAGTAGEIATEASLRAIANGARFTFDAQAPPGLVAIPSWHAVLALLGLACWSKLPYARFVGVPWALAIAASTVTTGWHYGVDVVVGALVAAGAWFFAGRFLSALSAPPRVP